MEAYIRAALVCAPLLLGAACGGEPPMMAPPVDEVAILVEDDFLSVHPCPDRDDLDVVGELEISGTLGVCRLRVNDDGRVRSLCEEVPGQRVRELTLVYYDVTGDQPLRLAAAVQSLDLTDETRDRVTLSFSEARREYRDEDDDGLTNFEEVCGGRDPFDPNG